MGVLTKDLTLIQSVDIYISKPFPKFDEIQNLSLDGRQGNKEKYLPLSPTFEYLQIESRVDDKNRKIKILIYRMG